MSSVLFEQPFVSSKTKLCDLESAFKMLVVFVYYVLIQALENRYNLPESVCYIYLNMLKQ
jgi:hypothetical protein